VVLPASSARTRRVQSPAEPPEPTLIAARALSEFLGTALLLATVVGSGIMGERLAGGNVAIALLANSIATGAGLVAFILAFGDVSGAHFNPLVTLSEAFRKSRPWSDVPAYVVAQLLGALAGVVAAHAMFALPLVQRSTHERSGGAQGFSELVATMGLLLVIQLCSQRRPGATPYAVGAYITAAYWFTASTSFANPAVTLARSFTDTFAGIRPSDVPAFVLWQIGGAVIATAASVFLSKRGASKEWRQ
jgi:glycerol uptake facilitator-like aquaporin